VPSLSIILEGQLMQYKGSTYHLGQSWSTHQLDSLIMRYSTKTSHHHLSCL